MLNQKTREILGALGAINQSQIISYPVTVVKMGKSIQAFLNVGSTADNGCQEEEFEEKVKKASIKINEVKKEVHKKIVGQDELINSMII